MSSPWSTRVKRRLMRLAIRGWPSLEGGPERLGIALLKAWWCLDSSPVQPLVNARAKEGIRESQRSGWTKML